MEKTAILSIGFNINAIYPLVFTAIGGLIVLLMDLFSPCDDRKKIKNFGAATAIILLGAFLINIKIYGQNISAFNNMVVSDNYTVIFNGILILAAFLTVLYTNNYSSKTSVLKIENVEFYSLLLFSLTGMLTLVSANDLITVFLGIETMSIPIYILVGIQKNRLKSNEAALKYFLMGAFSTGFLLFGISLIFGTTGTTNLTEISAFITELLRVGGSFIEIPKILLGGIALLIIGLGFKVAAFPFQFWTPDVYEGAPTPVTSFMATAVKAAAFAAFFRIFYTAFADISSSFNVILITLAMLTMTVGNISALMQKNVKRMLAYSSIAHAGYLLVPIVVLSNGAKNSLIFYLAGYAVMNLGAFTIAALVNRRGKGEYSLDDYSGLHKSNPGIALMMTLFLLSMAGIPPLVGFMGKFYIFSSAIEGGFYWLTVVGVLNSALSVYYYIKVIIAIYFNKENNVLKDDLGLSFGPKLALGLSTVGVVLFGVYPRLLLDLF